VATRITLAGAVLLLAVACSTQPSPSSSASPSASPEAPSPSPTLVAGAEMCTADDLTLAAGLAGAAAGTSYLEVDVVRPSGSSACDVFRWPTARIVDPAGDLVAETEPHAGAADVVGVGDRFVFNLGWSSWCNELLPPRPLTLEVSLTLRGNPVALKLPDTYGPSGCLGTGTILSLQPAT
jgi:hypothetical protein